MRIIGFAVAMTYMLIAPLAHAASQEMLRCLLTGRWCLFDDVDPVTQVRTRHALVSSEDAMLAGANISRTAILLECQNGKPAWWLTTARSFSYGPFGIRYRLDPGGVVGETVARPEAGGDLFRIRGEFPAAMVSARRMMFEAKLANGATRKFHFDISGTEETLKSLGCAPAAHP